MGFEFHKKIDYYSSDCYLGDLFKSVNKIFKNGNLSAFEDSVVTQLISNELPIIGGFGFVPLMFHSDIEKGYAFPIHNTSSEFVLSANDKPHWDGEGLDEHRGEYNNQFTEGSEKVSYRWGSPLNEIIDGGYAYNDFKSVNNGLYVGCDVDGDLNFQSLTNVATKNIELHNHTNFYGVDLNTNNDTNRTSKTEYNDVISYITPYSDISYTCGIGVQCNSINSIKCYPLLFEGVDVDKFDKNFKITESDSFTLNGDVTTYEPRHVCGDSKIGGVFILYLPINQLNRCCIEVLYNNIAKSYIDDNIYYTQGISIPAYAKSVVDDYYCNGATTYPKMFYQEFGSQKYLYFEKIHYIDDSGVKFVKNKKIEIQDTNSDYFCFIHNNMCIIKNSTFSKFVFDNENKFDLLNELFP